MDQRDSQQGEVIPANEGIQERKGGRPSAEPRAGDEDERDPGSRIPWRLIGSLIIGVGLGWMLVRGGLPIVPADEAFARLLPWTIPVYLTTLLGLHLLRALRWRHLLGPVGNVSTRQVLSTAWIGFAAVMLLPLRTGEVVRPMLIARRSEVRAWEAAGTVGAERVIDGLVLSAVLFAALAATVPLDPLPDRVGDLPVPVAAVPGAAYLALTVFAASFVVLILFHLRHDWSVAAIRATIGRLSPSLADRIAGIVERIAQGLAFLPSPRRLGPFLLETAGYWGLNVLGLWVLAHGCGLEAVGLWEACVIMGCLGIGILVPSGPGYFGTYQLSVYLALAMFVEASVVTVEGSAFVFISYVSQVGLHLLGGGAGAALGWLAPAPAAKDAEILAKRPPPA